MNRNPDDGFFVCFQPNSEIPLGGASGSDSEADFFAVEGKILKACCAAVSHIRYVLVAVFLTIRAGLGEIGIVRLAVVRLLVGEGALLAPEIAGYAGFKTSLGRQRAVIQATGSDLCLRDRTIGQNGDSLGAALPCTHLLVGLPVVEYIPLALHFYQATVGIAGEIPGEGFGNTG